MNWIATTACEFWELHNPPIVRPPNPDVVASLAQVLADGRLPSNPLLQASQDELQDCQFRRVRELVSLAYMSVELYKEKYDAAGFRPEDLQTWEDYHAMPVVTKEELAAAGPDRALNRSFHRASLLVTRSTGSTGQALEIYVDPQAIALDTIQGVHQLQAQTGGHYKDTDLVADVYTSPWWVGSVNGRYPHAFVSNLLEPEAVAGIVRRLRPVVLSAYPSTLESLLPHLSGEELKSLRLVVTHSEQSHRAVRTAAARILGCPVLDEYSSEELTRIALELPCGHYHLCEHAVRLDVLVPEGRTAETGQGLVVGTNLLNTAMPLIRYVQGDIATLSPPAPCRLSQCRKLEQFDGRMNDSFETPDGRVIPSGAILDVVYRWVIRYELVLMGFEVVQKSIDRVEVNVAPDRSPLPDGSLGQLCNMVRALMGPGIAVEGRECVSLTRGAGKHRPIRREKLSRYALQPQPFGRA